MSENDVNQIGSFFFVGMLNWVRLMVFTYATFVRTGAAVHSHRSGTDAVCGSIHWRFRGLAFVKSEQSTQFNSYYSSEFCCEAKKCVFSQRIFLYLSIRCGCIERHTMSCQIQIGSKSSAYVKRIRHPHSLAPPFSAMHCTADDDVTMAALRARGSC